MKYFSSIVMLFTSMILFGQVRNFNTIPKAILRQFNNMGVDDSLLLNSDESAFLNEIFKDKLKLFDFANKNIGFLLAGSKRNKKDFFNEERDRYNNNSTTINCTFYIFNAAQKSESGGYDGAIVYWSKFTVPIEKVVAKLKNK